MKRILFSFTVLLFVAGLSFAQNEAYLDQVGASAGTGTRILQQGLQNLLTGPGSVPLHSAAKLNGRLNQLTVIQLWATPPDVSTSPNYGWVEQISSMLVGSNWGLLDQRTALNSATIHQKSTVSNLFQIYQYDGASPWDGVNTAILTQDATGIAGLNSAYTIQNTLGDGNNFYNVKQKSAIGTNLVDNIGFTVYLMPPPSPAGIYQHGFNNISDAAFSIPGDITSFAAVGGLTGPAMQTSDHDSNLLSVYQNGGSAPVLGSMNVVCLDQKAHGSSLTDYDVAVLYQDGPAHVTAVVQAGKRNLVVGKQGPALGIMLMSINQQGSNSTVNTAIYSQL